MPTLIEYDIRHDTDASFAMTAIVASIAILIVTGIAIYSLQLYPFYTRTAGSSMMERPIDMNANGFLPMTNP